MDGGSGLGGYLVVDVTRFVIVDRVTNLAACETNGFGFQGNLEFLTT